MNKVHRQKIVMLLTLIFSLVSCVFVPEVAENQKYSDNCNMLTKKLTLSARQIKGQLCDEEGGVEACLMVFGVVVPAGSFVVSGSVVLVGNALHWLERQGPCNEVLVNKGLKTIKL